MRFLDKNGLDYFWQQIVTKFTGKFNDLEQRVGDLEENGSSGGGDSKEEIFVVEMTATPTDVTSWNVVSDVTYDEVLAKFNDGCLIVGRVNIPYFQTTLSGIMTYNSNESLFVGTAFWNEYIVDVYFNSSNEWSVGLKTFENADNKTQLIISDEDDYYAEEVYPSARAVVKYVNSKNSNMQEKKQWVNIFEYEVVEDDIYELVFTKEAYPDLFTTNRVFYRLQLPKQTEDLPINGLYIEDEKNAVVGVFWTTKRTTTSAATHGWLLFEHFGDVYDYKGMTLQVGSPIIGTMQGAIALNDSSRIVNATSITIKNHSKTYPIPKGLKITIKVEKEV